MCRFRIGAVICSCSDANCCKKPSTLNGLDAQVNKELGSHIRRINRYVREGDPCADSFTNENLDRLTVYYGMNPEDATSKQDCKNKTFVMLPADQVFGECYDCLEWCCQSQELEDLEGFNQEAQSGRSMLVDHFPYAENAMLYSSGYFNCMLSHS